MAAKTVIIVSIYDWVNGAIYNYPEPRYTAELYLEGYYDPDLGVPSKTANLNLGNTQVDFDGYNARAILTVRALDGFKLTSFENRYYSNANYTLTDSELVYELTEEEMTMNYGGLREYVIEAIEAGLTPDTTQKRFIVGNVRDSNGVRYDGEVMYSAKVTVIGSFDFATQTYPTQEYNLPLGVETVITVQSDESVSLELDVLNGFEFVSFENVAFPSNEYSLTPLKITYYLTEDELTSLDPNAFKYVATAKDSADIQPPDTVTNNYLLTKDRFKAFQSELFNRLSVETIDGYKTLVTEYLSSAKLYPFNINPVNIWGEEVIKIRDYTFSTLGKVLNNDYIVINFGEIETPKINDNATDIVGVTCDLIMPFRQGVISLDSYKVIGKKITIEGRLYITKGEITINIYDSNGINFNISNFTIGADYLLNSVGYTESNMFSPNQALTLVNKAYILIKTPIYDETPKVLREGILNAETGRIEVTEVNLKGNILGDEKTLIESLLKNGVYIND